MKKKILFVITLMVSIFSFSSSVLALTKINFKETGNGQINTTLHFEEGFVGGIDITLKVKGNVSVQDFKFADKIVSSKYDSEYVYDKDKNTLIIRVTTGGIGSSHNLLNNKKELELGTIDFTSSDKADVVYELEETAFKIVGNNWESQVIDKESIHLVMIQNLYTKLKVLLHLMSLVKIQVAIVTLMMISQGIMKMRIKKIRHQVIQV